MVVAVATQGDQHHIMSSPASHEPRSLAYLAGISPDEVAGIGPKSLAALELDGIRSVADLLLTVPRRYLDRSQLFNIKAAPIGEEVTIGGTITKYSSRRLSGRRSMVEAVVSDGTSTIKVVWFNPWLKLKVGDEIALSGKIEVFRGNLQMKSPEWDRLDGPESLTTGRVVPIYPKLGRMKPPQVRKSVANAVRRSVPIADLLPKDVLDRFDLVERSFALSRIHFPDSVSDVPPARRRLIFDEFLRIQMALKVRAYDEYESQLGVKNSVKGALFNRFLEALPYDLTQAQLRVLEEILMDMAAVTPMHRLLQGEVGSGKTVVVIAALLTSVESGHQAAVMAPTEVLAIQHYLGTETSLRDCSMAPGLSDAEGTESLFGNESSDTRSVRIGLFTGQRVTTNFVHGDVTRAKGLGWLADGTIDIAFGTQALIQKDVEFRSLGVTVIDEQHRFGVEQRVIMRDKSADDGVPDLLLMTATPIPRTLAMTLYGDLSMSVIDELPPGRSPIITTVVGEADDAEIDKRVQAVVSAGHQVFVVCPLVEDSDKIDARSAETEILRVRQAMPDVRSDILHGQMASDEKASVMDRFRAGEFDVLVATTVIEVGIDVQNATLMVIRNADRFGLSQLHQLRGRVGRGEHPGSCLLVSDPKTPDGEIRITAMVHSNDGFELSEIDLELRGQGTVFGGTQSGAADLRLGNILKDHELLDAAARLATESVEDDPQGSLVTDVMHEVVALFGESAQWLTRS